MKKVERFLEKIYHTFYSLFVVFYYVINAALPGFSSKLVCDLLDRRRETMLSHEASMALYFVILAIHLGICVLFFKLFLS